MYTSIWKLFFKQLLKYDYEWFLAQFQSTLYRILWLSNDDQTNSYKVLVFEIWLFENQSPDGPQVARASGKG